MLDSLLCKIPKERAQGREVLFLLMVSTHAGLASLPMDPKGYGTSQKDTAQKAGRKMGEKGKQGEMDTEGGTQSQSNPSRFSPWPPPFRNYAPDSSIYYLLIKRLGD